MLIFNTCKPLIGVIHLPPLPGSPGYKRRRYPPQLGKKWGMEEIIDYAVQEARKYEEAGFNAVIIENYGDKPYTVKASVGQASSLAIIAREVVRSTNIPVGVSLLRNSGYEAVYAMVSSGASFARINNLCEVRVSPEGVLLPAAHETAKALSELNAYEELEDGRLSIFADIDVKHSWPVADYGLSIGDLMRECLDRIGFPVKAIVVSGPWTGIPPKEDIVKNVYENARNTGIGVVIGSGITSENMPTYWRLSDGFIVGTWVKLGRITENVVAIDSAKRLAAIANRYRSIWPCSRP